MPEPRIRNVWNLALIGAGGVVAVVAALLLAIIATARSILGHATRAEAIAADIVANTKPIWELEQTNKVATQLLSQARSIEQHATEVADTLDTP